MPLAYARCFKLFSKLKCMDDAATYLHDTNTGPVRLESFAIDNANTLKNCEGDQRKQNQYSLKMFSESYVTEIARGIQILIAQKHEESLTSPESDENVTEHNYSIRHDTVEVKDERNNLIILHNALCWWRTQFCPAL